MAQSGDLMPSIKKVSLISIIDWNILVTFTFAENWYTPEAIEIRVLPVHMGRGALSGNVMFCLVFGPPGDAKEGPTVPVYASTDNDHKSPWSTPPNHPPVIKFGLICYRGRGGSF